MSAASPRIAIGPAKERFAAGDGDMLAIVTLLAEWLRTVPHVAARDFLVGLMEEGRDFAGAESGMRWRSILIESDWAARGWLLWNMLEMDDVVADSPARPDSASAAIENLVAAIRAAHDSESALPAAPPADAPPAPRLADPRGDSVYDERNAFLMVALGTIARFERAIASLTEVGDPLPAASIQLPERGPFRGSILR